MVEKEVNWAPTVVWRPNDRGATRAADDEAHGRDLEREWGDLRQHVKMWTDDGGDGGDVALTAGIKTLKEDVLSALRERAAQRNRRQSSFVYHAYGLINRTFTATSVEDAILLVEEHVQDNSDTMRTVMQSNGIASAEISPVSAYLSDVCEEIPTCLDQVSFSDVLRGVVPWVTDSDAAVGVSRGKDIGGSLGD